MRPFGILNRTARFRFARPSPRIYPGTTTDHVQVTNGGSEAELHHHLEPRRAGRRGRHDGAELHADLGLARAFGATIRDWPLVETPGGWRVDIAALDRLVSPRSKLIVICNPNNPTGARFDAADLDAIASIASRHGAWVLSDEIYRGAELDGRETPSMWGRHDRVIVTSGLSKAYALPGLRIGWVVGAAAARRVVVVVSRLHDHFARGIERRPRSPRARAGSAGEDPARGRAAS